MGGRSKHHFSQILPPNLLFMPSKEQIALVTQLFQAQGGVVEGVARRFAPPGESVDDIIQRVYQVFLEGVIAAKYDLSRDITPLLYQIAKREALLLWRKKKIHERATERLAESLVKTLDRDNPLEEFDTIQSEQKALRYCLDKLPPKSRAVIHRHYFEGVPMKTIAEEQNAKPATVRDFFYRIRLKLRECIERTLQTIDSLYR